MASELWEIVRADELRVGDVIRELRGITCNNMVVSGVKSYQVTATVYIKGEYESPLHSSRDYEYFRRYTGPSPEVLMRALRMAEKNSVVEDSFGRLCQGPLAEDYIQLAEAEIAAETKGGAK